MCKKAHHLEWNAHAIYFYKSQSRNQLANFAQTSAFQPVTKGKFLLVTPFPFLAAPERADGTTVSGGECL